MKLIFHIKEFTKYICQKEVGILSKYTCVSTYLQSVQYLDLRLVM